MLERSTCPPGCLGDPLLPCMVQTWQPRFRDYGVPEVIPSRGPRDFSSTCENTHMVPPGLQRPMWHSPRLPSVPITPPSSASAPPTLLLFLEHAELMSTPGPLHLLFHLPKHSSHRPHPFGLHSSVTSSERPSLTTCLTHRPSPSHTHTTLFLSILVTV